MSNTAEQNKIAWLLKEARAWTPEGVEHTPHTAHDTITRLADALEKVTQGEIENQYRVTYRSEGSIWTRSGYSLDTIAGYIEYLTGMRADIIKVEVRTIITSPWEEDK